MIMNIPNIEAVGEDKCMQFKTDATTKIKTAARPLVDQIFNFFDQDGNGEVTFEEFAAVVMIMQQQEDGTKFMFDILDKNKNGKLEVSEAAELIKLCAKIAAEV